MSYSFLKDGIAPDTVSQVAPYIPRQLWQTCPDAQKIHPKNQTCIDQLLAMNPTWQHNLFGNDEQRVFIRAVASDRFFAAYERINPKLGVSFSDVFRYMAVFLYGGAYFDVKGGSSLPLDQILRDDDRYILSHWDNVQGGQFPGAGKGKPFHKTPRGEYENWFLIAQPGHQYLAAVLEQVMHNIEGFNALRFGQGALGVLNVTGPHAYTHVIRSLPLLDGTRKIVSAKEGIHYSNLADAKEHQRLVKNHYTRVNLSPVLAKGLVGLPWMKYWRAEILMWPYSRIRTVNQKRLRALHKWRKRAG